MTVFAKREVSVCFFGREDPDRFVIGVWGRRVDLTYKLWDILEGWTFKGRIVAST